jgi:hypothetical protein
MAFEVTKMGKLADRLESEAYDWCLESIKSHFDIDPGKNELGYENDITEVLNEDHIKEIEEFIKNITALRKNVIENHYPEKIDISDYREEGVKISKIMIGHIKTMIRKLYDIKVNSSNDIYYLKNYNDVFKFTTQTSKYMVINENNFNIVELPIEFAIFILFPLNDSSKLTEFQKKYIIGKFDLCLPNNLITQLRKIKYNHDLYHKDFMSSRVLNGMPFELNTTLFWQYKLIDNLSVNNLKYLIYIKYKMFKIRKSLKQTLLSTAF